MEPKEEMDLFLITTDLEKANTMYADGRLTVIFARK